MLADAPSPECWQEVMKRPGYLASLGVVGAFRDRKSRRPYIPAIGRIGALAILHLAAALNAGKLSELTGLTLLFNAKRVEENRGRRSSLGGHDCV
jgi:hypothetical protein